MEPEPQNVMAFIQEQVAAIQARLETEFTAQLNSQLQAAMAQQQAALHQQRARAIKPPSNMENFSGKLGENPQEWAFTMDTSFNACQTPAHARLGFAATCLRDSARTWWRTRSADADAPTTWEGFKAELITAFQPINPVKVARDKLARLTQTNSVRLYASTFKSLALEIPGMTDDERKDRFIRGLKKNTQKEVELREPATFEEAVRIAERYDAISYRMHNFESVSGASSRGNPQGPVPMELGSISQSKSDKDKFKYEKLTPQLREQLEREGKCTYCRTAGHNIKECKKLQARHPNQGRQ